MAILLAILSLVIALEAQITVNTATWPSRIINGKDAEPGEIPYQVSLQRIDYGIHFCGGIIINEYYVLTGARCVDGKSARSMKVIAATTNLNEPQSNHTVEKIIIHEDYDEYKFPWVNDIALIKVKEKFTVSKLLNFVLLPDSNYQISHKAAYVSGWGWHSTDGVTSEILQKAEVTIADQNYCKKVYMDGPDQIEIYDTHICAYNPEEPTGPCYDDFGGPLVVDNVLIGIVTKIPGPHCGSIMYPNIYTRVTPFLDWIKENDVL